MVKKQRTGPLVGAVIAVMLALTATVQAAPNGVFAEPAVDGSLFAPITAPVAALIDGMGDENGSVTTQFGANNQASTNILGTGNLSIIGQSGTSNSVYQSINNGTSTTSDIAALGNLALVTQTGANNRAVQVIEGSGSSTLLVQGGSNNSVFQGSYGDRNFQLVGVSGNNNQVAYVQAGNNLNGVLDVRNSTNSSVVAMQTDRSARYLMPVGLRGLNNQIAIIVPGRMYVFRRP